MLVLAAACADAPPPGAPADPAPVTDSDSGTPPPEDPPLDLTVVTWSASFGWDDGPVAVSTGLGPVEPEIVVTLGDDRWASVGFDPAHVELYCEVAFSLADRGPAAWTADDDRLWHGLDAGPPTRSTCPEGALPEAGWGVAVGELSPFAAEFVGYVFADPGAFFGGRVLAGEVLAADDEIYGRAWALDDDGALQVDADGASTSLDADQVFADGSLARAWYRLESIYIWPLGP